MADLTVIKYERNGDPEYGLQDWGTYLPDIVASGEPLQHGHTYLDTATSIFSSGVWTCSPHELVSGPFNVDEFVILLEGSIVIDHESGDSQRFRSGDSFIIPKGAPIAWKQDEAVRIYYAVHDDPEIPLESDPELKAIAADPKAELPAVTGQDPAMYESEVPEVGRLTLYKDPTGKFQAGVWDCSPMKRMATTIERSELMHILDGSGSITNADGEVFNFRKGDTFMVPAGMGYQWQNDTHVRKIFCSYAP